MIHFIYHFIVNVSRGCLKGNEELAHASYVKMNCQRAPAQLMALLKYIPAEGNAKHIALDRINERRSISKVLVLASEKAVNGTLSA